MSFLDRITGSGRAKNDDGPQTVSKPFDELSPPANPNEVTVRLGGGTAGAETQADSSIITEAAPSELAPDFAESRHPGLDPDSFNSGLPVIGSWPLARQQRTLILALGAGFLLLLAVGLTAIYSGVRSAGQVGAAGQASTQSQRLAKSVSQALVGNAAAFPEVKESIGVLAKNVRGLKNGDSDVSAAPGAYGFRVPARGVRPAHAAGMPNLRGSTPRPAPWRAQRLAGPAWLERSILAVVLLIGIAISAPPHATAADAAPSAPPPRIEVAFVLDATGSMGSYIAEARSRIKDIAEALSHGTPAPALRFALVSFRDKGDAYVTRLDKFTAKIDEIKQALDRTEAAGGGDTPESVLEGLAVAIRQLECLTCKIPETQSTRNTIILTALPNDGDLYLLLFLWLIVEISQRIKLINRSILEYFQRNFIAKIIAEFMPAQC